MYVVIVAVPLIFFRQYCIGLPVGDSGVGVRLKVGINIEKSEGVGSGEGLCPPQLGAWGLAPRKKSILR